MRTVIRFGIVFAFLLSACGGGGGGTTGDTTIGDGDLATPADISPETVPDAKPETAVDAMRDLSGELDVVVVSDPAGDEIAYPDGIGEDVIEDMGGELPPVSCNKDADCAFLSGQIDPWTCSGYFCHKASGECVHADFPEGYPCSPRSQCEKQEGSCKAGKCVGGPLVCDDSNPCTDDSCDEDLGCLFVNNQAACDDGNDCTLVDSCEGGWCVGKDNQCDCTVTSDCAGKEDGNLCNGTLTCLLGKCAVDPLTIVTCLGRATDPCREIYCEEASGACLEKSAPDGKACDDGDACTEVDVCLSGACVGSAAKVCDDSLACSDDSCVPAVGCVFTANTDPCDDGNDCTNGDVCKDFQCVGTPTASCGCSTTGDCAPFEDGDACNGTLVCKGGACVVDSSSLVFCDTSGDTDCLKSKCDPGTGLCGPEAVADGVPCDDGDSCTLQSGCDKGECLPDGQVLDCDDGDACNGLEACDPAKGCVAGTPPACSDGDACNGLETCDPVDGCQPGAPPMCDDGDACNGLEACDPAKGCVAGTPPACSDGDACNGLETCDPVDGCQPGAPPMCDDGDTCNGKETCDPASGCESGVPLVCNDKDACNGQETCDPVEGCLPGTPPVCDDGDVCNGTESCDHLTGCQPGAPLNCTDGNYCTDDLCDEALGCSNPPAHEGYTCTLPTGLMGTCVGGICVYGCLSDNDCDDLVGCTSDSCNQLTGECVFDPVDLACDDGDECNGSEECDPVKGCVEGDPMDCSDGDACNGLENCVTGQGCVDGTPLVCDDKDVCNGLETCDTAAGCLPGTPLACDDGDACNGLETCDASGGCQPGTALDCNDSNPCTEDSCNKQSGCLNLPANEGMACQMPSGSYGKCIGGSCSTDCTEDADCNDGVECTADSCNTGDGNCVFAPIDSNCDDGDACNGAEECSAVSGCVPGPPPVCDDNDACNGLEVCDKLQGCVDGEPPVCDDGNACNGVETCDASEGCLPGVPLSCDDGDKCNGDESCDEAYGCVPGTPPVCNDGDACNGIETCDKLVGCMAGNPLECDDGKACNGLESCDTVDGCVPGAPLVCDNNDACDGIESCDDTEGCLPGTPPVCDDGDACNGLETCDMTEGCQPGTPLVCDDGKACNGLESCDKTDGCQPGTPLVCDDGDVCNGTETCDDTDGCQPGTPLVCDDGKACNGSETCDTTDGCQPGTPLVCDDSNACTGKETCDDEAGCLPGTPLVCDDGDACNGSETCDTTDGCRPGTPLVCDDGKACNGLETCDPASGCLEGTPVVCDDGKACNGLETCDETEGCLPGEPLACDDGDMCNGVESCDDASGCVDGTPMDCQDGDACNGYEVCHPTEGCGPGVPLNCNDNDVCNGIETCNSETGCVAGTPLECDDGDACNGVETCNFSLGCLPGTPLTCDDGNPCNGTETCDGATGCVPGTPVVCQDDGDKCNGYETCEPDFGCVSVDPLACDDNDKCNGLEYCDPATGCVAGIPLQCDDGDVCNGAETCSPLSGCMYGDELVCDDGKVCNGTETCDPTDGCQPGIPFPCDDGLQCNGVETCDEAAGCLSGTPPVCDDGDKCNGTETCQEGAGCVSGMPLLCDNGDPCDGVETCDSQTGCVPGTPVVCDDGDACNGVETCGMDGNCVEGSPLECDDGDPCNGVETCVSPDGCVSGTPDLCTDKDCGDDGCGGSCGECDAGYLCDDSYQCVAGGNDCVYPLFLYLDFAYASDTSGAGDNFQFSDATCPGLSGGSGSGSPDMVFSFVPPAYGYYDITLTPQFDSVLYVTSDCNNISVATCLGADDQPGTNPEKLTLTLAKDQAYFVVVDGASGGTPQSGQFSLLVEETCQPQCDGKDCGDDGCGGSCGTCEPPTSCDDQFSCRLMLCPDLFECVQLCTDQTCIDQCTAMGTEATKSIFNSLDACLEVACPTDDSACMEAALTGACADQYQACLDDTGCTPQCTDKECGSDSCGGSCGDCQAGTVCGQQDQCIPEGSNCNVPIVVDTLPFSDASDTTAVTADLSFGDLVCPWQDAGRGLASPDIVYRFIPGEDMNLDVTLTPGAAFDSTLYVYETDCQAVTEDNCLAADDNQGAMAPEHLLVGLTAGVTYYVVVDGWSNSTPVSGTYNLEMVQAPMLVCEEMYDDCMLPPGCLGDPDCLDHCSSLGTTLSGLAFDALTACIFGEEPDFTGPCDPLSSDPACSNATLTGTCASEWAVCQADIGCEPDCMKPDGVTPRECGDDGCVGSCGTCDAGYGCDPDGTCILEGDSCFVPLEVSALPFQDSGDTTGMANDHHFGVLACPGVLGESGTNSPDLVYEFTPQTTGDYVFTLEPSFDSVLYVTSDCQAIDQSTCLGADDADGTGFESVTANLTSGTTYYVIVDGGSRTLDLHGAYTLTIDAACSPDCVGRECGGDGCGGSCGDCQIGNKCSVSGQCDPYLCPEMLDCVLQCAQDDACEQACFDGTFSSSQAIIETLFACLAACETDPDPLSCVEQAISGTCATEYQACLNDGGCQSDCNGKECGDDGCGGSCGSCQAEEFCGPSATCLPLGDDCQNAFDVDMLPYSHSGDTISLSDDYFFGSSACTGVDGQRGGASSDAAYRFVAPSGGAYSVLLDSDFDSTLYVVSDCQDISNSCLGGDDQATGVTERVDLNLALGQTVYIIVDGYSNTVNVAGAYTLQVARQGSICAASFDEPTVPFTLQSDTSGMGDSFSVNEGSCAGLTGGHGSGSNDVVARFSPEVTDQYDLELDAAFDALVYVVTDCTNPDASCLGGVVEQGSGSSILSLSLTGGTDYYVIVDGWGNVQGIPGTFSLSVGPACIPDCDGKSCGDDGCGGTCGDCSTGTFCDPTFQCVPVVCSDLIDCVLGCPVLSTCFDPCASMGSVDTQTLYWDVINCVIAECGADPDSTCFNSTVAGACSTQMAACDADTGCVPDCNGRECGDDSCGGSCGTCQLTGMVCDQTGSCVPEGRDCSLPVTLVVSTEAAGYTYGAVNLNSFGAGACPGETGGFGESSEDRVYAFTPESTGSYTVTLTPTDFDSVLYVVTDCDDVPGTCVGASEEPGIAVEQLTVPMTSGTTYFIIVDGASSPDDAGSYSLVVDPAT